MRKLLMAMLFALLGGSAGALYAGEAQPLAEDPATEKRLIAISSRSCVAWSVRTNRWPGHTPNWPTTCAAKSAR
jgi:hypothetical protein